jgi:hypothetical protein
MWKIAKIKASARFNKHYYVFMSKSNSDSGHYCYLEKSGIIADNRTHGIWNRNKEDAYFNSLRDAIRKARKFLKDLERIEIYTEYDNYKPDKIKKIGKNVNRS